MDPNRSPYEKLTEKEKRAENKAAVIAERDLMKARMEKSLKNKAAVEKALGIKQEKPQSVEDTTGSDTEEDTEEEYDLLDEIPAGQRSDSQDPEYRTGLPTYHFPGTWDSACHKITTTASKLDVAADSCVTVIASSGVGKASISLGEATITTGKQVAQNAAAYVPNSCVAAEETAGKASRKAGKLAWTIGATAAKWAKWKAASLAPSLPFGIGEKAKARIDADKQRLIDAGNVIMATEERIEVADYLLEGMPGRVKAESSTSNLVLLDDDMPPRPMIRHIVPPTSAEASQDLKNAGEWELGSDGVYRKPFVFDEPDYFADKPETAGPYAVEDILDIDDELALMEEDDYSVVYMEDVVPQFLQSNPPSPILNPVDVRESQIEGALADAMNPDQGADCTDAKEGPLPVNDENPWVCDRKRDPVNLPMTESSFDLLLKDLSLTEDASVPISVGPGVSTPSPLYPDLPSPPKDEPAAVKEDIGKAKEHFDLPASLPSVPTSFPVVPASLPSVPQHPPPHGANSESSNTLPKRHAVIMPNSLLRPIPLEGGTQELSNVAGSVKRDADLIRRAAAKLKGGPSAEQQESEDRIQRLVAAKKKIAVGN